jgi:hypothetical protein
MSPANEAKSALEPSPSEASWGIVGESVGLAVTLLRRLDGYKILAIR